jgi:hypothetical protein
VAIGYRSNATSGSGVAIGATANASATSAVVIGPRAIGSGGFSTAIGPDSETSAQNAVAIGRNTEANGENSVVIGVGAQSGMGALNATAIGRNSSASATNATAIGFGSSATLMNQMAFGQTVTIYTLPGLGVGGGSRGTAGQSGNVQYVTTDDNGNLGTTGSAPGASKTSAPAGTTKSAASSATSAAPVSNRGPRIEDTTLETELMDLADRPVSDGPQVTGVSNENIGSNLTTAPNNTARPVARNQMAQQSLSAFNANAISVNSQSIDVNTKAIQSNKVLIDQAFSKIDSNTAAIQKSLESLQDVEQGLAAVAALPDMYLGRDDAWAASGGAAVFGDELGFGGTLAIRASDNWSVGASAAIGGDQATGKVQFRYRSPR